MINPFFVCISLIFFFLCIYHISVVRLHSKIALNTSVYIYICIPSHMYTHEKQNLDRAKLFPRFEDMKDAFGIVVVSRHWMINAKHKGTRQW